MACSLAAQKGIYTRPRSGSVVTLQYSFIFPKKMLDDMPCEFDAGWPLNGRSMQHKIWHFCGVYVNFVAISEFFFARTITLPVPVIHKPRECVSINGQVWLRGKFRRKIADECDLRSVLTQQIYGAGWQGHVQSFFRGIYRPFSGRGNLSLIQRRDANPWTNACRDGWHDFRSWSRHHNSFWQRWG